MTIHVHQWPEEATRSPGKSCRWVAEAIIDGITYTARSRHGAPNELARVLVAAGIPDAPMAVSHGRLRGETTYRSFHEIALWTYEETATKPLHRVRWVDPAIRAARITAAFGPKQGVKRSGANPVALPVLDAAEWRAGGCQALTECPYAGAAMPVRIFPTILGVR
jgi:hypothetical protein